MESIEPTTTQSIEMNKIAFAGTQISTSGVTTDEFDNITSGPACSVVDPDCEACQ